MPVPPAKIPTLNIPSMAAVRQAQRPAPKQTTRLDAKPIDPEAFAKAELNEVQKGFIARAKAEEARRVLTTDSEYWVCLCFQTRAQVEAFLRESGWGKPEAKYVDGRKVAAELEIALPPDPVYPRSRPVDNTLSSLVG